MISNFICWELGLLNEPEEQTLAELDSAWTDYYAHLIASSLIDHIIVNRFGRKMEATEPTDREVITSAVMEEIQKYLTYDRTRMVESDPPKRQ